MKIEPAGKAKSNFNVLPQAILPFWGRFWERSLATLMWVLYQMALRSVVGCQALMQTSLYHSSIHGKAVKILVKYQSFRTSEDPAKPSYRHKTIEIHLWLDSCLPSRQYKYYRDLRVFIVIQAYFQMRQTVVFPLKSKLNPMRITHIDCKIYKNIYSSSIFKNGGSSQCCPPAYYQMQPSYKFENPG